MSLSRVSTLSKSFETFGSDEKGHIGKTDGLTGTHIIYLYQLKIELFVYGRGEREGGAGSRAEVVCACASDRYRLTAAKDDKPTPCPFLYPLRFLFWCQRQEGSLIW